MYTLEGVGSIANLITAYEETPISVCNVKAFFFTFI